MSHNTLFKIQMIFPKKVSFIHGALYEKSQNLVPYILMLYDAHETQTF